MEAETMDPEAMDPVLKTIRFTLNGMPAKATVATHHTVIEMLQDQFALFGARESCAQGLCGCCTVYVDGVAVSGCLTLAALLDGSEISTVEHLDADGALDPVQEAFVEAGGFQCGFCTPGMVMMAKQMLDANADPSEDDIRHYLSGNLCRCAAYPEIIEAVKLAARKRAAG